MSTGPTQDPAGVVAHQRRLGILARATPLEITSAIEQLGEVPAALDVRPPEIGMVMIRGRIGGDGQRFNAGEATVTRAVVQIAGIGTGYAWRLGRAVTAARQSAIIDALWLSSAWRERIETEVLAPLAERQLQARQRTAAEAAATRVEFFTMARERS